VEGTATLYAYTNRTTRKVCDKRKRAEKATS